MIEGFGPNTDFDGLPPEKGSNLIGGAANLWNRSVEKRAEGDPVLPCLTCQFTSVHASMTGMAC